MSFLVPKNRTVKETNPWCYLDIAIQPDPIIHADTNESKQLLSTYETIEMDLITWNTLILTSLNKLYGLIGESSPFEIIKHNNNPLQKQIILKIQVEDQSKFNNSLMSYTFNLSKYFNDLNLNCNFKINKIENYVGLVL
ncbi:hypothetical protein KGF54_002249 [Candida jiufengensis]|uniref:uncharacterized protein n=1 Tax=Candida jiufengensis TaxID=497108 RepID=UPI00222487A1|nr:uncharacterized protein KGF54_002249 [Candida jiufengensis]KAI5954474.1 hypothetical protein KGF54_002249 [Candida jiufengensis]